MYKIIYFFDNGTNVYKVTEYGFANYLFKRLCFMYNEHEDIEIQSIFKLCFSLKTLKKCLTGNIICDKLLSESEV